MCFKKHYRVLLAAMLSGEAYNLKGFTNVSSCHFPSGTHLHHPTLQMEKLRARETNFSIPGVKQTVNYIDLGCEHQQGWVVNSGIYTLARSVVTALGRGKPEDQKFKAGILCSHLLKSVNEKELPTWGWGQIR